MDIVQKALEFATKAHEGQVRKYTYEPYINHPVEVMKIVQSVVPEYIAMHCAALLHDVQEDCGVTNDEITNKFGNWIAALVDDLSDVSKPEDGNRSVRKEIDRKHTAQAYSEAKTIKLADLISNTKSIVEHDKEFAKVYIKEKELLLEVLTEGDPTLYAQAKALVEKAKEELGID